MPKRLLPAVLGVLCDSAELLLPPPLLSCSCCCAEPHPGVCVCLLSPR